MKHYSRIQILLLLFIQAGFLACERPEQPAGPGESEKPVEQPQQREETIPFQQELLLTQLFPELVSNPNIQEAYDQFYISLGTQSWSESFQVGEVYIPAQTSEPVFLTAEKAANKVRTWNLRSSGVLVLNQHIPEGFESLENAKCQATFRLHFALDDASPYKAVTLSYLSVDFPSWLDAEPVGGRDIPAMEITKEGLDIEFKLTYLYDTDHFEGKDGERYIAAETSFSAIVTAAAEDASDPSATPPASVRIKCTLETERIDFERCSLSFSSFDFPWKEMKGEAFPLPSFLAGAGSDLFFNGAEIYIRFQKDLESSHLELSFPDVPNNPTFQVAYPSNYALLPMHDGWDRPGYDEKTVPALQDIFREPTQDGTLTPRMNVRAVIDGSSMQVTPDKEYRMSLEADWRLPLLFSGKMTGFSERTETISLDGDKLDAPGTGTHAIGLTFRNFLPFDCVVTPVFTLEGNDPVFLDSFTLKGYDGGPWYEHTFTPGKDHWKASLYFIITPSKILNTQFGKNQSLILQDTRFTANLKTEE
ncbi:MAG: hypothetical protein II841_01720 [Bacteroidales bacterium]|nr:hypothetical protein [Bacteroidales bacterium]